MTYLLIVSLGATFFVTLNVDWARLFIVWRTTLQI
jgi:hypothetical protein